MKPEAKRKILAANNIYAICTLLLLLWLSGCKTLEDKCLERFPLVATTEVREVVVTDTLVLPDTWIEYVDTTVCPPGLQDTLLVIRERTRFLPGDTIYRETICVDTVTIHADAAKLAYLASSKQRLEGQLEEANVSARRKNWLLLGAGALVALFSAILLRMMIG